MSKHCRINKISIQSLDRHCTNPINLGESSNFEKREQDILARIKKHYSHKLGREVQTEEAKEIAYNLLHFAQAIYG